MYVLELEKGVWFASGEGDPSRTLKIENAKHYKRRGMAKSELRFARMYRPFLKARIVRVG
jgi:hypothetical protein